MVTLPPGGPHAYRQVAEGFGADDAAGGSFTMRYATIAATAARL
jgi:hypothetical protein